MAIASALLLALLVLSGSAGTGTCTADDHECRDAADAAAADAAAPDAAAADAAAADAAASASAAAAAAAVAAPQPPPLRFQVGDIVLANMGRGSWNSISAKLMEGRKILGVGHNYYFFGFAATDCEPDGNGYRKL